MLKRILTMLTLAVMSLGARADDGGVIAPDQAQAVAARGGLLIVDVRTPSEWAESGIPQGAVTIDIGAGAEPFLAAVLAAAGGDRGRKVAVICRSGHRSTMAKALLDRNGFTDVLNIKEGVLGGGNGPGWKARSLPMQAWGG